MSDIFLSMVLSAQLVVIDVTCILPICRTKEPILGGRSREYTENKSRLAYIEAESFLKFLIFKVKLPIDQSNWHKKLPQD